MNNQKRKELYRAIELLEEAQGIVETIMDEEQDCFDNFTEGLKQTMRGQDMEEAIGNMEMAIDSISDAVSAIEDATL